MNKLIHTKQMWIIIGMGVVIIILIALIANILLDDNYFSSFSSNFMATIAGLIVGIPVAIELATYQERKMEEERKNKILILLNNELQSNLPLLINWDEENVFLEDHHKFQKSFYFYAYSKTQFWDAFSDGGELEWIKDPDLLALISTAYYYLHAIRKLCYLYLETKRGDHEPSSPTSDHALWTVDEIIEIGYSHQLEAITGIEKIIQPSVK